MHRNAIEAPCTGLQDGALVADSPVGQSAFPTYPLKPSRAYEPAHIPLRKSILGPRNRQTSCPPRVFGVRAVGSTSTARHETHRVPTLSHRV